MGGSITKMMINYYCKTFNMNNNMVYHVNGEQYSPTIKSYIIVGKV